MYWACFTMNSRDWCSVASAAEISWTRSLPLTGEHDNGDERGRLSLSRQTHTLNLRLPERKRVAFPRSFRRGGSRAWTI